MATPDATHIFGTSAAVKSRTEEFEFINEKWLADQADRYVGSQILSMRDVGNSGQASAYGDDFGWDSDYAEGTGVRALSHAAPLAGPLSRRVYYHDPVPRGRVVGLDKADPNVRSEGSVEKAATARSQATYARCLQLIDRLTIDLLFSAATPWLAADVAAGTPWSDPTADINAQIAAALGTMDDPEDANAMALPWGKWQELLNNDQTVAKYGGNVGAGLLTPELARSSLAGHGIDQVFVYRNRWGVLGDFVNLFNAEAVVGTLVRKPDSDERGISVRSAMPAGAFEEVELWYAFSEIDAFADVVGGVRLSGT